MSAGGPGREAKRTERLHRQRALRTWRGSDGSWNLMVKDTPEVGAQIEAALAPLNEAIFQTARLAGNHESGVAYGADALVEMARRSVAADEAASEGAGDESGQPGGQAGSGDDVSRRPAGVDPAEGPLDGAGEDADEGADSDAVEPEGAGPELGAGGGARRAVRSRRPDTKVIVLISHEALKRGLARGDETCEIAGVGPVSVATVEELLGDAFGAAIVTDGVNVHTVAHLGRSVTAHQRTALEARGYCCEVPGCGSTTALEIDHIAEWARCLRTKLESLAWLCKRHHALKTHRGWRLEGPPGDRRWIPPEGASCGDAPKPEPSGAAPNRDRPTLLGDPSAA